MAEKLGIEKIKKGLALGIAFKNQTEEALKDGFQTMDIFGYVDELSQLPEAIKSAPEMLNEVNDLSLTEREEIRTYLINELNVAAEEVEETIVDVIDWLFATYKLIKKRIKA